jgi:hypothetical protein
MITPCSKIDTSNSSSGNFGATIFASVADGPLPKDRIAVLCTGASEKASRGGVFLHEKSKGKR